MMQVISIALGGALGALCRYGMSNSLYLFLGRNFPYGTLAVNIIGSIIMGFAYVMMIERIDVSPDLRAATMIGFLGAFTTFSTFSIETLNLLESGDLFKASLNIVLSVTLCISGCWLGMIVGRNL